MTLSGQSQAELIKAALIVAMAGVVVYYGKKFIDGASAKLGSIANAPAEAVTAIGNAVGSAGAAVIESAKSGIEKAASSMATQGGTPILTTTKILSVSAQNLVDNLLGNKYTIPFDTNNQTSY